MANITSYRPFFNESLSHREFYLQGLVPKILAMYAIKMVASRSGGLNTKVHKELNVLHYLCNEDRTKSVQKYII